MCHQTLRAFSLFVTIGAAGMAWAQGETTETTDQQNLPVCPPDQTAQNLPNCPKEVAVVPPAPEPAPVPVTKTRKHNIWFAPSELSIMTGAGVANYFGSHTPSADAGAAWNARVLFGAHSIIGLEGAYVGSFNELDHGVGVAEGKVASNGFDGMLRIQAPLRVQPYAFAGVGYNHMDLDRQGDPTLMSRFNHSDEQLTIPAGGGVSAYLGRSQHMTLDLRGTYRLIADNNIVIGSENAMHQWMAQAQIGYTF